MATIPLRHRRPTGATAAVVALALLVAVVGCGTDTDTNADAPGDTPDTSAPNPTVPDASVPGTDTTPVSIRGERYCEVLAVSPSAAGLTAEVYSTFPLNDCPDDLWQAIDPATLANQAGTPIALPNGPRYWMIDSVTRTSTDDIVRREFGGLAMNRYATVSVPDLAAANQRYVVREIDRLAVMTVAAGQQTYVLVDPDGATYVMQSYSQQVDPELTEAGLATLGDRLMLPPGWRYETRTLTTDLTIEFGDDPARVVQDELMNTYSLAAL